MQHQAVSCTFPAILCTLRTYTRKNIPITNYYKLPLPDSKLTPSLTQSLLHIQYNRHTRVHLGVSRKFRIHTLTNPDHFTSSLTDIHTTYITAQPLLSHHWHKTLYTMNTTFHSIVGIFRELCSTLILHSEFVYNLQIVIYTIRLPVVHHGLTRQDGLAV